MKDEGWRGFYNVGLFSGGSSRIHSLQSEHLCLLMAGSQAHNGANSTSDPGQGPDPTAESASSGHRPIAF